MARIKWFFWNTEEHRLRFLWRLVVFALFFAVIVAAVQALIYFLLPGISDVLHDEMVAKDLALSAISENITVLALLLTLVIIGRFVDKRPFSDYGFRMGKQWLWDFVFGLFLGALLMIGIFSTEYALGWVQIAGFLHSPGSISFIPAIFIALILFIGGAFLEEIMTRGYLLHNLAEGLNFKFWRPAIALILAWLISSSLFGLMHLGNPNATAVSTANLMLAGLFLGLGYILTNNLALPIGLHLAWNFFQGNVFGFPVSGTSFNSVTFIAIDQRGPELWTGGAFGPEAGIIGLFAIGIGALLILAWVKWRYGQIRLQLSIPQPPPRA